MGKTKTLVLLAIAGLWMLIGSAQAETEVRVIATHPAGDVVTLGKNQRFYLRIAYSTDEPASIWTQPVFQGREVAAGSNPSRTYTGSGEALGWFFFMEPGQQVDEVRIRAGDGTGSGTRVVATYPVRVTGSARPAAATSEPAWVVELRRENKRLQDEAFEKQMSTSPGAGAMLFVGGFMLAVVALGLLGIFAPVWAMRRWSGGWRLAAAVPAVMIAFVVVRIVVGVAVDPTSHNLWPFEILQVGTLSIVVIGVLFAARKFSGAAN